MADKNAEVFKNLVFSSVLRFALTSYGIYHDLNFAVKFTDIDYFVFTDASRFIWQGESPYLRDTYRYTPVLAWLLTPNIFFTQLWGKLLFCASDLLAGYLIYKILLMEGSNGRTALFCAQLWLYNPLTLTVSSRGNAESMIAVLVLLSIYCTIKKGVQSKLLGAVVYGFAIHMKIYPVTFSLPIYLYLNDDRNQEDLKRKAIGLDKKGLLAKLLLPNKVRFLFALLSALVLLACTVVCYKAYGFEFLYETYLYHVVRRDTRHNFSPYFYMLYLSAESSHSLLIGLAAFLPQALLLIATSLAYYEDLAFCCFVNTFIFVTFNKVCTSQYFLWYLSLLPLIVPKLNLRLGKTVTLIVAWFFAQGLWLLPAYYLEFEGKNTFIWIWLAGLVFFSTNVFIMGQIITSYSAENNYVFEPLSFKKLFRAKKLR